MTQGDRQDPHTIDTSALHPNQRRVRGRRGRARRPAAPPRRNAGRYNCDGCGEIAECAACGATDCGGADCGSFFVALVAMLAVSAPRRAPRRRTSGPALAGVAAIRVYQKVISPRLRTVCRHTPTCSRYGIAAVRRYGLAHGARLTADRISRCTSAVPHGTPDPVP